MSQKLGQANREQDDPENTGGKCHSFNANRFPKDTG